MGQILRGNNKSQYLLSIYDISDNILTYLILVTTLWGKYPSYSYVTNKETEVQRGQITCSGSLS